MKRHLRNVALLLVLGAIVNVAVAWGCVLVSPIGSPRGPRKITTEAYEWALQAGYEPSQRKLVATYRTAIGCRIDTFTEVASLSINPVILKRVNAGLPCLSFSGGQNATRIHQNQGLLVDALWLGAQKRSFNVFDRRLMPLRPIWPGFAINTIFYAAVLWLLFAAPFKFRRHRRSKRGLCTACGYPVATSEVCTECGKPVRPRPLN